MLLREGHSKMEILQVSGHFGKAWPEYGNLWNKSTSQKESKNKKDWQLSQLMHKGGNVFAWDYSWTFSKDAVLLPSLIQCSTNLPYKHRYLGKATLCKMTLTGTALTCSQDSVFEHPYVKYYLQKPIQAFAWFPKPMVISPTRYRSLYEVSKGFQNMLMTTPARLTRKTGQLKARQWVSLTAHHPSPASLSPQERTRHYWCNSPTFAHWERSQGLSEPLLGKRSPCSPEGESYSSARNKLGAPGRGSRRPAWPGEVLRMRMAGARKEPWAILRSCGMLLPQAAGDEQGSGAEEDRQPSECLTLLFYMCNLRWVPNF